ncbi:hypothetical protein HPB49_005643 [Dermacentor silvarum]|uniref:Uncharacterized protein n=1 Tax=Dermacentor silvarum TaxID=543639 RepID=A0ACB8CDL1_DERSI|nr:hypothetical protein HPB49_005643 [Dermacentor silvarum]
MRLPVCDLALPEFRGFQDDPAQWLKIADSLGDRHGWSDGAKRSYAEGRLREAAEAWNRYNGHTYRSWREWSEALLTVFGSLASSYDDRFMRMHARRQGPSEDVVVYIYDKLRLLGACSLTWPSPTARQYVLDGLLNPTHGAILAAQPLETTAEVFSRKAAELQESGRRRQALATLNTGSSRDLHPLSRQDSTTFCGRCQCNDPADSPQENHNRAYYETCELPLLQVHVDKIDVLCPAVDTDAERSAMNSVSSAPSTNEMARQPVYETTLGPRVKQRGPDQGPDRPSQSPAITLLGQQQQPRAGPLRPKPPPHQGSSRSAPVSSITQQQPVPTPHGSSSSGGGNPSAPTPATRDHDPVFRQASAAIDQSHPPPWSPTSAKAPAGAVAVKRNIHAGVKALFQGMAPTMPSSHPEHHHPRTASQATPVTVPESLRRRGEDRQHHPQK